jgi:itaconate CoA-transferase
VWLNRSKESLTLDVKHPDAPAILERLLASADVFVQNLAPGAADRLGLGAGALLERHPRMIVCGISGYGATGPDRDRKAYDLLIQAEAGLLSITGTPEMPSKVGISIADIASGMYGYSGILTALFRRERTGARSIIEVSMLEALGEWMSYAMYYAGYGGTAPPRSGPSHAAIAPYGPFTCGDGKVVYLGLQNEREWVRFCEVVLERPALAADERFSANALRVRNRAELEQAIGEVFARHDAATMLARLDRAQIATARMNTMHEFKEHPQLAARDRWRTIGSPAGPIAALVPPATFADMEPYMGAVPDVGEHTDAILRELGYDDDAMGRWRSHGAI